MAGRKTIGLRNVLRLKEKKKHDKTIKSVKVIQGEKMKKYFPRALDKSLESLSKRRFCQLGRQLEVSCVVIDGE